MRQFGNVELFLGEDTKRCGEPPELRERVYEGLLEEEPIRIDDWAGPQPKERRQVLVVALTPKRLVVVENEYPPQFRDDGSPRLWENDWELVDTWVREQWSQEAGMFLLWLVDRRTGVSCSFRAPGRIGYAGDIRRVAANLAAREERRERARSVREWVFLGIALLACAASWVAAYFAARR